MAQLARELLAAGAAGQVPENPAAIEAAKQEAAARAGAWRDAVIKAGGLAVFCSQRSPSRRHDEWLRGLAGQRGEPGESQILLSLEDPLVEELSSSRAVRVMLRAWVDGRPASRIEPIIDGLQSDEEAGSCERRRTLRDFERVENGQREQVYAVRQGILQGGDLRKQALETIDDVIGSTAVAYENPADLHSALSQLYPVSLSAADVSGRSGAAGPDGSVPGLAERLGADARLAFESRERELGQEAMWHVMRRVTLTVIDDQWAKHLAALTLLFERLSWNGEEESAALAGYQRDAAELYATMLARTKEDTVRYLFSVEAGSAVRESTGKHAAPADPAP